MSILIDEPLAKSLTFDLDNMCVEFVDGRKLIIPLAYFPRLFYATDEQRRNYEMGNYSIFNCWCLDSQYIHRWKVFEKIIVL